MKFAEKNSALIHHVDYLKKASTVDMDSHKKTCRTQKRNGHKGFRMNDKCRMECAVRNYESRLTVPFECCHTWFLKWTAIKLGAFHGIISFAHFWWRNGYLNADFATCTPKNPVSRPHSKNWKSSISDQCHARSPSYSVDERFHWEIHHLNVRKY